MNKPTLSTLKSFVRRNINNLTVISNQRWSGMIDGVEYTNDHYKVNPIKLNFDKKNNWGLEGAWFVGGSKNYITEIENGFKVSNCCGVFKIVVL